MLGQQGRGEEETGRGKSETARCLTLLAVWCVSGEMLGLSDEVVGSSRQVLSPRKSIDSWALGGLKAENHGILFCGSGSENHFLGISGFDQNIDVQWQQPHPWKPVLCLRVCTHSASPGVSSLSENV